MTVMSACFRGWALALTHPSYILIRWLANLVFAVLIVYPLALLLSTDLDHSLFSLQLLDQMDHLYPWELAQRFGAELAGLSKARLSFFLLFALLGIYLSGGILNGLQSEARLVWREFFQACATRFPALVVTALLFLIPLAIAVAIPLFGARGLDGWHLGEKWHLWSWILLGIVGLLCISFVARFYDNSRLLICRPGQPGSVLANLRRALSFTARYHFQTFAIWVFFTAIHVGVIVLYSKLAPQLGFQGPLGLLIEVVALQVLILARITVELARLGGELDYLKGQMGPQKQPESASPPRAEHTSETVETNEPTSTGPANDPTTTGPALERFD